MLKTDPGVNWSTSGLGAAGTKTVYVTMIGNSGNEIVLGTASSNNNNDWVDDQSGTLKYAITKNTVTAAPSPSDFVYTSWTTANASTPASS